MSTRLMLLTPCDEFGGHSFHLRVEESSGSTIRIGGDEVPMPWLRAACSCGWVADDERRFTIEENAHWLWFEHVKEAVANMAYDSRKVTPLEREEWKALAEADTLHMLPPEALIASIKHLATRLLEVTYVLD